MSQNLGNEGVQHACCTPKIRDTPEIEASLILWQEIISIIESHHSFIITSHINPDCDALGSELALAEQLRYLGKQVTVINSDVTPPMYRFLDSKRRIKQYSSTKHAALIHRADVVFVLDASGGWERVGAVGQALAQTPAIKVCIDHHPDATDFVDIAVIDTDAAATAELIYDLFVKMEAKISKQMAQALYAAIITDTGNFRFPKTSPKTHCITAKLVEAGAVPSTMYQKIYEQNSLGSVRLKGHVMESIRTAAQGQIAYYGLTQKTLKEYGAQNSELDGFASLGQPIAGVRVVIFCSEASQGRIKISLRSDGSVAINQIAAAYNGGGHTSAAGAIVEGNLEDILTELVKKVETLLVGNN